MTTIDLTNCDREPIHIPGKIQEHGFLIAVNKNFEISCCSENIEAFLPVAATALLGKPASALDTFLCNGIDNFIEKLITVAHTHKGFKPLNPHAIAINGADFNLIINQSADQYLIEFESDFSDLDADIQQLIGSSLSEMLADPKLATLLYRTAEQIKTIIAYDRVMIYKFHDDGHGEVVAESKNDDLPTWLGLHYPASDIPQQARELYKINLTRLIADLKRRIQQHLILLTPLYAPYPPCIFNTLKIWGLLPVLVFRYCTRGSFGD
jgi:chemotaxis family two-component system sensor kinase Cph1